MQPPWLQIHIGDGLQDWLSAIERQHVVEWWFLTTRSASGGVFGVHVLQRNDLDKEI